MQGTRRILTKKVKSERKWEREKKKKKIKETIEVDFTVSPCILIHYVLFTPTIALFHTTMYQSFKLY